MEVPYDELHAPIRELVRVLNERLGLVTIASCGRHENPDESQAPAGSWWVTIRWPLDEAERLRFEFLAWAVRDWWRSGRDVTLQAIARPPFANEPGTTLMFELACCEFTPDEFAGFVVEMLRVAEEGAPIGGDDG